MSPSPLVVDRRSSGLQLAGQQTAATA
uniref:Uncharacterized protein n=1 Tax=Arundo donax TaxID=35708 RepID=A0A0A9BAP1_ARUDO